MVKSDRHNSTENDGRVFIFVVFNSFEPVNSMGDSGRTQLIVAVVPKSFTLVNPMGKRQCNMILWQDSLAKKNIQNRVFLIESFSTIFSPVLYTFLKHDLRT